MKLLVYLNKKERDLFLDAIDDYRVYVSSDEPGYTKRRRLAQLKVLEKFEKQIVLGMSEP